MADQLSATEQLIQQLRRPQQDKTQDVIRALTAFTSPETQKQVLATMPQQSALSPEEQRLAAASKLEQALYKSRESQAIKSKEKDMSRYTKLDSQMRAAGRGSKLMRDLKTARNKGSFALGKLEDMIAGRQTANEENLKDLSSQISAMLTGGVPSQTLIDQTAYNTLKMKLKGWQQFLKDSPVNAASPEVLKEILAGVKKQIEINQGMYADEVRLLYNNNRDLFNKPGNEMLKEQMLYGLQQEGIDIQEDERGFIVRPAAVEAKAIEAQTGQTQTIKVRHPDGRTGQIPLSNLDAAKAAGFKEIQ